MNTRGHNERSYRLDQLAAAAREGLKRVDGGEYEALLGWLDYGIALNEGRSLFPSDEQFGQWIVASGLHQVGGHDVHDLERAAAMWAASHADQLAEAQAASKARTLRGLHAKWKEIEAEREAEAEAAERARLAAIAPVADPAPRVEAPAAAFVQGKPEEPAERAIPAPSADRPGVAGVEAPPPADPDAKLRAEFRAMTDEGRESDWIALRHENAELRKRVRNQTSQIADLKQAVQQLGEGSDMGKALSAKIRELGAVKLARDEALRAAKAMEYRLKKAEAKNA